MVVAIALVVAAALLWRWQATDAYVVEPPSATASSGADATLAAQSLRQLEAAMVGGDSEAARVLGDDEDSQQLLAAAVANVDEVGLTDLGLRYLSETDATMTADTWSAEVEVTWRVADADGQAAARSTLEVGFAQQGRTITGVGGELVPLWLQGPVVARRGGGAVVMMARPGQRLDHYHRQARTAVTEVERQLGRRTDLVVEVPATTASLDRAVGADEGTYDGVAAVTTGSDGTLVPGSPLHVYLNPTVYGGLDELAAQVVMTHEAVHVVTEAPFARNAPLWLLEGFADFVALRDLDLPLSKSAGQIIAQVRDGKVPDSLPSGVDFDTGDGHLGATYEAAWQVCEVLAERRDDEAVVAFYDAVTAGSDLETELEKRFGWTEAELTRAWQQRLRDLASRGG